MIEPFHIDLFPETVASFVARSQLAILFRRHRVVTVQIDIASDAKMFGTDQLRHVIEMIEYILDRGRLIHLHKHPHACDSHYAAGGAHLLYRFIWLAARMTRSKCAAVRMGDQDRFL